MADLREGQEGELRERLGFCLRESSEGGALVYYSDGSVRPASSVEWSLWLAVVASHPPTPFNPDEQHPDHRDYIATNLLDALTLVPDTGDWHGELRNWCKQHITGKQQPNRASHPPRTEGERELSFDEAMVRAKAAHTPVKTCHQPGNDYRKEYVCRCGAFVFAESWDAHVLHHADALRALASVEDRPE